MNKARPWLTAALLAVGALVVWRSFFSGAPEWDEALGARREALAELGRYLADHHPPERLLVLSNPFVRDGGQSKRVRRFEEAGIEGIRMGIGEASTVELVYPEIKPEYRDHPERAVFPPDTSTPLSFLMEPSSLDSLMEVHPDCKLVVSLIGLPVGVDKLELWQRDLSFALLLPDLRLLGNASNVLRAFQQGKIKAVVIEDPDKRVLTVVDASQAEKWLKTRPDVFGFKRKR
tara:strand:+ start:447 stop:1142 length:696 start_codon:yes stop_codon:yes gene_type:complete